jgi:glucose/arabinose dehydrogenase
MKHFIQVVVMLSLVACTDRPSTTATATLAVNSPGPSPSGTFAPATDIPPTEVVNVTVFPDPSNFEWRLLARGLGRPVDIQNAGDDSGRLFIVDKSGHIRIYQDGKVLDEPFLNIALRVNDIEREQGLLGLAFHPAYQHNGYFYVNYTDLDGNTVISRFRAQGDSADPFSEAVLLRVEQPYINHNGGALAFGPEGYLYIALGDGGGSGDPSGNAQNPDNLLGKILRIDVDHGEPYAIPSDNPFGNEVWAYGLRNPWRISFDSLSGDLWIADVGERGWEEVNYLQAGLAGGTNFGWSIMEGSHGYDGEPDLSLRWPAAEYSHDFGCSITGGYVYRGPIRELNGIYLYGDYCTGFIWGTILSNTSAQTELLFQTGQNIITFGVDEAGQLYMAGDNGNFYLLAEKAD